MLLQVSHNSLLRLGVLSIFLTIALVSCGPAAQNLMTETENQPLTVLNALSRCDSEPNEYINELKKLARAHSQGLFWAERFAISASSSQIKKISRSSLEEEAKEILAGRLKDSSSESFEAALLLRDELLNLRSVLNQIQRLKFLECHMDDYWKIGKIPYDAYQESLAGNTSVETTAKLCAPIKGQARCILEARMASKKGRLKQVHDEYRSQFQQKFFAPRFQLSSKNSSITCTKKAGYSVLNVPVNVSPDDYQLLVVATTSWWSAREKFRINLIPSTETGALVFNRIAQGPSFVAEDNPSQINLAPGHAIPLVVAHEFGHVLGFPDCYFESWSRSDDAFVYIEFEQSKSNLMCTLDSRASVPEDYFKQLKQAYCID